MSSPSALASGGGSPCNAEGGGIPSAHAWKRLFWFSFQNFSHSLPCSTPFMGPPAWGRAAMRWRMRQCLECHDLSDGFPLVQAVEALVDLRALQLVRHLPVHRELPLLVEVDVVRQDGGARTVARNAG